MVLHLPHSFKPCHLFCWLGFKGGRQALTLYTYHMLVFYRLGFKTRGQSLRLCPRMSIQSSKRLTRSIAYTARTVSLFVILSEAKNLVVALARECLFYPLFICLIHTLFRQTRLSPKLPKHPSALGHSERSEESRRRTTRECLINPQKKHITRSIAFNIFKLDCSSLLIKQPNKHCVQ